MLLIFISLVRLSWTSVRVRKKKKKCLLNLLYEKISHVVEDRRGQAPVKSAYFVKIIEMMPKFRKLASSRGLWSVQRLSEPSVSLVSLCLFL